MVALFPVRALPSALWHRKEVQSTVQYVVVIARALQPVELTYILYVSSKKRRKTWRVSMLTHSLTHVFFCSITSITFPLLKFNPCPPFHDSSEHFYIDLWDEFCLRGLRVNFYLLAKCWIQYTKDNMSLRMTTKGRPVNETTGERIHYLSLCM